MIAVIMAGGKGTRIASVAPDIPKPMMPINGKPVLERQIECLREQGIREYIITVSHKKEAIMEYFGNGERISTFSGRPFDVNIHWFIEEKPLGNAGALFKLRDCLTEDFLLINGDVLFDVNICKFLEFHKKCNAMVTLFSHPNSHPYDSGLIFANREKQVTAWLSREEERPEFYKNRVNAGLHIIKPKVLDFTEDNLKEKYGQLPETIDLDRHVLKPLAGLGRMYCYDSSEYVRDMGTPERYENICRDEKNGLISRRNLKKKQKAIFLDRDGTINRYVGFLRTPEEFELLPGVAEAIKEINGSEYLAIVVTNQPVIARGEVTEDCLQEIHNKMETLLGKEGAYLDAIYYCPHHPNSGFEGEVKELKIECQCRKPKPGLFYQAAEEYNIDLSASWMIGDGGRDIEAGKRAGCRTILIGDGDYMQDKTTNSLKEAVRLITEEK